MPQNSMNFIFFERRKSLATQQTLFVELFYFSPPQTTLRGRRKMKKNMNNIESIDNHVSNKSLNETIKTLNRFNERSTLHNVGLEKEILFAAHVHMFLVELCLYACVRQHNNKKSINIKCVPGGIQDHPSQHRPTHARIIQCFPMERYKRKDNRR